ncbi:MAG: GNAT family N-acetyltransferase [Sneathiella sp.]|nr:GNAT family N-acetyltransferase [Sneathiella sp.]
MATNTEILVRPSTSHDIAAITEIYGASVMTGLGTFEIVAPDSTEMTARRNNILQQQLPYLVAEQDSILLGFAYAGAYRPRPAYRHTVENSVYVGAEARAKGIGKALLSQLIVECKEVGKKQMIAVIGDSGNRSSIALHRSLGFRFVGVLENVGFKFDRWVDTVIMQKNLEIEE